MPATRTTKRLPTARRERGYHDSSPCTCKRTDDEIPGINGFPGGVGVDDDEAGYGLAGRLTDPSVHEILVAGKHAGITKDVLGEHELRNWLIMNAKAILNKGPIPKLRPALRAFAERAITKLDMCDDPADLAKKADGFVTALAVGAIDRARRRALASPVNTFTSITDDGDATVDDDGDDDENTDARADAATTEDRARARMIKRMTGDK